MRAPARFSDEELATMKDNHYRWYIGKTVLITGKNQRKGYKGKILDASPFGGACKVELLVLGSPVESFNVRSLRIV